MEIIISRSIKETGLSDKSIIEIIKKILNKTKCDNGSLSINYVGEKKIRSLNNLYRGKDKVTDVIAFAIQDGEIAPKNNELGDIFICLNQIKKQAKEYEVSFVEEEARILIHGVLHLLGYDHIKVKDKKIMFDLQEKFLKTIL